MALNMWLKTTEEDSLIQMKVSKGLIINNPKFNKNIELKIENILNWKEKAEVTEFEGYLIYTLSNKYFMIKADNENFENLYKYKDFIDEIKSNPMHWSEEIDWYKQIPDNSWYFEYKWNYYLVISCNDLTDEINEDNWVYKWMIINPEKYYEVKKGIKEVKGKIENVHYINQ